MEELAQIMYTSGRIEATVDILDAIDSYLKDCSESEKKGLLQARKLVDSYGREKKGMKGFVEWMEGKVKNSELCNLR